MTDDRDNRSSSPSKSGSTFSLYKEPENDYCKRCKGFIYPLELMGPVMGYKYHKQCFRCHTCDRLLDFINYRTNLIDLNDKQLYCVNHNPRNGKYTETLYSYRTRSKSPGHFESTEYSTEYHREVTNDSAKFLNNYHHHHHHDNEIDWKNYDSTMSQTTNEFVDTSKYEDHLVSILNNIRKQQQQETGTIHKEHNIPIQVQKNDDSEPETHEIEIVTVHTNDFVNPNKAYELADDRRDNLNKIVYEILKYNNTFKPISSLSNTNNYNYNETNWSSSNLVNNINKTELEYNHDSTTTSNLRKIISEIIRNENTVKNHSNLSNTVNEVNTINSNISSSSSSNLSNIVLEAIKTNSNFNNNINYNQATNNFKSNQSSSSLNSSFSSASNENDLALKDIYYEAMSKSNSRANNTTSITSTTNINSINTSSSITSTNINTTTNKNIINNNVNNTHLVQELDDKKHDHLKEIFYEATKANNTRYSANKDPVLINRQESSLQTNDSNLKDIFHEVNTINSNRSKHSLTDNTTINNQINYIPGNDDHLKEIYYEALIASASRSKNNEISNRLKQNLESSSTGSVVKIPNSNQNISSLSSSSSSHINSSSSTMNVNSVNQEDLNLKQVWREAVSSYNKNVTTTTSTTTSTSTTINKSSSNTNIIINSSETLPDANLKQIMSEVNNYRPISDEKNLSNIKYVVSEVVQTDSKNTNKTNQNIPINYQKPVQIQDTENLSNIKNIVSEIIHTDKKLSNSSTSASYSNQNQNQNVSIPIQTQTQKPDPEGLSNLKMIISQIIHTDASSINRQTSTNNLSTNRQISDARTTELTQILGENKGLGIVRLTIQYDEIRTRLSITVHEAKSLKNLDAKGMIDPYTRVYLAPDEKPSFKRKTKIVKNTLNPKWQETFDYPMSIANALNKQLTVSLKDERGFFEKQEKKFLGEVVVKLKSIPNIEYPFTRWFYLQPINKITAK